MRIADLFEGKRKYYFHASTMALANGEILRPSGRMHIGEAAERFLETHRPPNFLSRQKAVFMVGSVDDVWESGAAGSIVYRVVPLGRVQTHDAAWIGEIESWWRQPGDGDTTKIEYMAANYWWGEPHPQGTVWEYLTEQARIVDFVTDLDDHEID